MDKCRNVGISSTMKGYVTFNESEAKMNWNYGGNIMNADGYFCVSLPLKILIGFPEHYYKILLNAKHELVLLRSKNDNSVFVANAAPSIQLNYIH